LVEETVEAIVADATRLAERAREIAERLARFLSAEPVKATARSADFEAPGRGVDR